MFRICHCFPLIGNEVVLECYFAGFQMFYFGVTLETIIFVNLMLLFLNDVSIKENILISLEL